MRLTESSYVPTLAIRPSEMNGLERLPGATKDRLQPCILLAPWSSSSSLQNAIARVEMAYPNRPYFLDIDRDYRFSNLEAPAQQELVSLLKHDGNFENWQNFVSGHEHIQPCLQTRNLEQSAIVDQIRAFQEMGRTFVLRIVRDRYPVNMAAILGALNTVGTADYVIILEGGWVQDAIGLEMWFNGIIQGDLSQIEAAVPIVLSFTSIPTQYSDMTGVSVVPFSNRMLLENVLRNTNRRNLVYGDWGSTRPRTSGGFGRRPLDRIDYPGSNAWHFARNKDEGWTFRNAANAIVSDSQVWDGNLNIWGEEMILQTTVNEHLGIDTAPKNIASRVNIHLHLQANPHI